MAPEIAPPTVLDARRDTVPLEASETDRRGFTRILGRLGIGLVAWTAAVWADAETVEAGLSSPCCSLASNTQCSFNGLKCRYNCPSGSQQKWFCQFGSMTVACGECTPSSTCWTGPFSCSIWWFVGSQC